MKENFATLLETVADVMGDRTAVIHGPRSVSFAELDRRASRLAGHLAGCGVGQESRVAIALYNGIEYVESVFAVLKLGGVPLNVNYRYREAELTQLLADAGAEALVFDATLDDRVAAVVPELPRLRALVRVAGSASGTASGAVPGHGGGSSGAQEGATPYDDAILSAEPLPRTARDNGHWLMYTGGTTGAPKGVLTTHSWLFDAVAPNGYALIGVTPPRSLAELAELTRRLRDHGPRLITLPAPPLMHSTGMYCTLAALLAGGTVGYLTSRSYDPDELARLIGMHRATVMAIVGDVFARPLADALDAAAACGEPYDLSSLEWILSVGVTWSADVKERLLRHGDFTCRDVVAASEGGPFAIALTRRGDSAVTSRFELIPGARVVTGDGRDVVPGSGEVGVLAAPADEEIAYQGDPDKTAQTFRYIDGRRYCAPGDLAAVEADGSLVFKGRDGRVINTGGEKVFAEEVEQVLLRHPKVDDVYVVGIRDDRWGSRVAAVVASTAADPPSESELRQFVGASLADYKCPRSVIVVTALPRSPAGKADLRWAQRIVTSSPSEGES
ncbi:AMP-binding protein [Micromonospora sp. NPDC049679]|uniref:AMP-binding protein n=1 Tax=Micromonospora sp. NPDC049679 TaxID=3155920 RepID=UPI0033D25255